MTKEDIEKVVRDSFYTETEKDPQLKQFQKTLNFIAQFKTLEELPDACYDFGNFMTGRLGAINFMIQFDKAMKEKAKQFLDGNSSDRTEREGSTDNLPDIFKEGV